MMAMDKLIQGFGSEPLSHFLADDHSRLWWVESGKLDLFLVRVESGSPVGARHPVLRVEKGELLFGISSESIGPQWGLLAVTVPGSKIRVLDIADLRKLVKNDQHIGKALINSINNWVSTLSESFIKVLPPKESRFVEADEEIRVTAGEVIRTRQNVTWVRQKDAIQVLAGREDVGELSADYLHPVTKKSWLVISRPGLVSCVDPIKEITEKVFWDSCAEYNRAALKFLLSERESSLTQEIRRLNEREKNDSRVLSDAVEELSRVVMRGGAVGQLEATKDQLLATCRLIGSPLGLEFKAPQKSAKNEMQIDMLGSIARASNIKRREVILKDDWWKKDNGPILAFMEKDDSPVALIPNKSKGYTLHNVGARESIAVVRDIAEQIRPKAYMFYRPLGNKKLNLKDIMKFGALGCGRDVFTVAAMGVIGGLLGLVTPLATGMLFDTVIPKADHAQLEQLTMALLTIVVVTALFQYTRSVAMLRLEGKMDSAIQAAVWDRLLSLPVPFFRQYSAGDLAVRASGITGIRQAISGTVVGTILGSIFAIFSYFLLFYYSMKMALVATVVILVGLIFSVITTFFKLRYERQRAEVQGKISGVTLQLLGGISKLRIAGAEGRAFRQWARLFAKQRWITFRAENIGNILQTFNTVFPILASMTIFITFVYYLDIEARLTTGQFLAFTAAFGGVTGAVLSMTGAFVAVLQVVPMYERIKPIMHTLPEYDEEKADPGSLTGEVEVNHVNFSYDENGPQILTDVSIQVLPGQFVALVGASGSGKSTLLRLLLGFEEPDTGTIFYDGQDLAGLDVGGVRRQLGVVLQNGQLLQGDIFTNIVGSLPLTHDDAWEAARMCGLDQDIKNMPMGMHTVISEGGGGLSGGQKQRMLIARAIVHKPRILYFDEATSALDNRTQAIVSESLESLEATRVVIAHRLSTIVNADRIFVLDKGRVVQSGTFEQLMAVDGLFSDLAKRQIV